jgi:hypothetical protein
MKSLLAILLMITLTGCVAPVKREFPKVPDQLMKPCPELIDVPNTRKLSEVLTVVTKNYGQYNECGIKVDSWIEWYTQQKKIFDSVK